MKVIHYINQFFAGIGGEEAADTKPVITTDLIGPSSLLQSLLKDGDEVVATIVCGDNYYGENIETAPDEILALIKDIEFDALVAGPAFRAGRYGVACGDFCKKVSEQLKKITITSMNDENPGVEMFRQFIYIVPGGASAASMRKDLPKVVDNLYKIYNSPTLLPQSELDIFTRSKRHQVLNGHQQPASKRAVSMLLKKLDNKEYVTELPIPKNDKVPIMTLEKPLSEARIAIVTSGGIVPVDNPDRIQSASATRWGKYDVSGMDALKSGEFKTIHAGFDPKAANEDPNVITPIDVMRYFEKEGYIGSLDKYFYSTVGTGTTENEARRMGEEIVDHLKETDVDAVLLVST